MRACMLTSVHPVWDTRIYHREAISLAQAGYQVTIIATGVDSLKTRENIYIVGLKHPKWRIRRALNWLLFVKAALKTQADIFHFHDPDLLFASLLIKVLSGKPIIYDCHEPYREAMMEKEWIPELIRPLIGLTFDNLESSLSRFMSAVIIANPLQQPHVPEATLIANFPKLEAFDLQKQPDRGSAQVAYLGSLSLGRGISDLVEACQWLREGGIKVILIGPFADCDTRSTVKRLITAYDLGDVISCVGVMPYDQGIDVLTKSSIGVIPFRKMPAFGIAIPTKLFEYMACGLPVVASDLPPTTPIINEADCGITVPPENPRALANAVRYLLDHPEEAQRMGENGRRAVIEKYNWAGEAQRLLKLYRSLLAEAWGH